PGLREVADVDVVVAPPLRARDLAQVCAAAVARQRVWPRLSLPRLERRRLRLPQLRPGDDRPRRQFEPRALLEERRTDDAVLAPDEMRRLVADVRRDALDLELRRRVVDSQRPL